MLLRSTTLIGWFLAAASLAASAGASTVPVAAGEYVRAGERCRGAPFAALLTFDGRDFSGAHGDCITSLIEARGRHYTLQSSCQAWGELGLFVRRYTEAESVTVHSASRFAFAHQVEAGRVDRAEYRLCKRTRS